MAKAKPAIPYSHKHPRPATDDVARLRMIEGFVYRSSANGWILLTDPHAAALFVIDSARKVVKRWEEGDLAEAVRDLDRALHAYDGRVYKP